MKKMGESWKNSPRHAKMCRVDPALTAKNYGKLIAGLPRRHAALLFQLRTGHAPLRKHLNCIGKADSPVCPSCESTQESVAHFLFHCPAHERARRALFYEIGRVARCLSQLLANPEFTKPLFRYIHATKRFTEQFGNVWIDEATESDRGNERQPRNRGKGTRDRPAERTTQRHRQNNSTRTNQRNNRRTRDGQGRPNQRSRGNRR